MGTGERLHSGMQAQTHFLLLKSHSALGCADGGPPSWSQKRRFLGILPIRGIPLLLICDICGLSRADQRYDFAVGVIEREKFLIVDASDLV